MSDHNTNMSVNREDSKPEPRDTRELEGTLLPIAQVVARSPAGGQTSIEASVTEASVQPVTFFQYPKASQQDNTSGGGEKESDTLITAPNIPVSYDPLRSRPDHGAQVIQSAARRGLMDAEQEMEDIRRANQQVYSKNYGTAAQIDNANRRANVVNRQEESRVRKYAETTTIPLPELDSSKIAKESVKTSPTEFYEGTYGKEYTVSEYEVGTYETKEYETKEYKSIYE